MKLNPQVSGRVSGRRHSRARRAAAPVLRRPATILVPIDFSYAADRALSYAVPFARRQRARLALLHVVTPAVIPETFLPSIRTDLPQLAELSQDRLRRLARRMGIRPRQVAIKTGHAAQEILEWAREIGADLIIIGSRGHGALERFLLGTTAERVVREAACPVLVVPLPRQSPDAANPQPRSSGQ
jgi:nucleotide-binding universal stress UspA family protein